MDRDRCELSRRGAVPFHVATHSGGASRIYGCLTGCRWPHGVVSTGIGGNRGVGIPRAGRLHGPVVSTGRSARRGGTAPHWKVDAQDDRLHMEVRPPARAVRQGRAASREARDLRRWHRSGERLRRVPGPQSVPLPCVAGPCDRSPQAAHATPVASVSQLTELPRRAAAQRSRPRPVAAKAATGRLTALRSSRLRCERHGARRPTPLRTMPLARHYLRYPRLGWVVPRGLGLYAGLVSALAQACARLGLCAAAQPLHGPSAVAIRFQPGHTAPMSRELRRRMSLEVPPPAADRRVGPSASFHVKRRGFWGSRQMPRSSLRRVEHPALVPVVRPARARRAPNLIYVPAVPRPSEAETLSSPYGRVWVRPEAVSRCLGPAMSFRWLISQAAAGGGVSRETRMLETSAAFGWRQGTPAL